MSEITYRWIDGMSATIEEWDRFESLMAARGWACLNRPTSRILAAERDGDLLGYIVFQMTPYVGPLFVRPSARGTGIAEELSNRMIEFLAEINVRGWIVAAESQHAEQICIDSGMTKVEAPVYVMKYPFGGVEV